MIVLDSCMHSLTEARPCFAEIHFVAVDTRNWRDYSTVHDCRLNALCTHHTFDLCSCTVGTLDLMQFKVHGWKSCCKNYTCSLYLHAWTSLALCLQKSELPYRMIHDEHKLMRIGVYVSKVLCCMSVQLAWTTIKLCMTIILCMKELHWYVC